MKYILTLTTEENILRKIIDIQKSQNLEYSLHLGNTVFPLDTVLITKSSVPVNRPTLRGGVYFSDTSVFKIKATSSDLSLAPLLSKSMLGPNPEFQELEITTTVRIENLDGKLSFFVNLTNSMQSLSKIELNMTIIRLNLE